MEVKKQVKTMSENPRLRVHAGGVMGKWLFAKAVHG